MTTNALKAFFALLETEDDDFASLVQRFGIDPAIDLQNCDLTDVNFGTLTADTLNLTGSNLAGANLSRVTCKTVIGAEDAIEQMSSGRIRHDIREPIGSSTLLDGIILAVSRYQNFDWPVNQVIKALKKNSAAVLAFYDSSAEQDILTKRLCTYFTQTIDMMGARLLWFYSKASKPHQLRLDSLSLDKAFFDLLRADKISHDIGIYPFTSNQAAVERICKSTRGRYYNHVEFARSLRHELSTQVSKELAFEPASVVLFSGFPPISKDLYRTIRHARNGPINLIFLCSSALEPLYELDEGKAWQSVAVPTNSVGAPHTAPEDIDRLRKRIGIASGGLITLSENTEEWMRHFVGKPLATLKAELIKKLRVGTSSKVVPIVV